MDITKIIVVSRKLSSSVIDVRRRQIANHCILFNRNSTSRIYNGSSSALREMLCQLPLYASGKIIRGFGRGSKELGIPTANLPLEVVKSLPESLQTGVYYGWANVNHGDVHKMVLSVGWNPFYNNKEKSLETHILHDFNCDLYGQTLKICIAGYLRPERSFDSLDALITAIKGDIEEAKTQLDCPEHAKLREANFFIEEISTCQCT